MIRPHFDRAFFERIEGVIDGVFASSDYRVRNEGRVLPSQMAYARGTERYFAIQEAVMSVSVELGAEEATAVSGSFPIPLARHKRFFVAVCVTDSLKRLNGSKARRLLASLNAVLEPYQTDLFDSSEPVHQDAYFGMILVAKRQDSDQRQPAAIYFGVPTSTLRSWHFYEPVDKVVALYDEPVELVERVTKPRLRGTPRSATKASANQRLA